MLVSIITPTYNSSKYIYQTYLSIKNQTVSNWEWLVTDDCSNDDTIALLNNISQQDSRVKVFSLDVNSGAAVARNNSINKSSGDYIAFLDSDDLWLPNKLEFQIQFMGDNINFSFTAYEVIDSRGSLLGKKIDLNQEGSFGYKDMLKKKATLGCSTVMLRRTAFSDITMPLLRTGQDYALWLKLLKKGNNAYILSRVLTQYRISPNSISRNKFKKALRQWQIYRQIENIPLLASYINFFHYTWRAVFRK